jgi:CubicO group peptidase (beta-lactamase class C family)
MKNYLHLSSLLLVFLFITTLPSCDKQDPGNRFPLADEFNIDGEKLILAFDKMNGVEGALSLIVCRNDTIVAEEYYYYNNCPDSIKNIMSVTKTFTGTLIGLAIDRGYIESVDDPIGKYLTGIVNFTDDIKPAITIDQLLKMSFGHAWNGTSVSSLFEECFFESDDILQFIIDLPLINTPGTVFNYSDGASHLLSAIITEATGMNTIDFAEQNLFDPLGITDFYWSTDDRGYPNGAAYLRIKPRDMLKFGNLILHKGSYEETQIVPEAWINEMTTTKISTNNDVLYGPEYGYQIWLGNAGGHRYYMAMGWGGQFIFIVPDQQLVVTATCWTANLTDQQGGEHWMSIIKIIVEDIFPAVY